MDKPYPFRPYESWPENSRQRWLHAAHTFGMHLMQNVRDQAMARIPDDASTEARRLAEESIFNTMYAVMQLFDGICDLRVDDEHDVSYILNSEVRKREPDSYETSVCESCELAPAGDGLCMAIHGWVEGEFWPDM